MSRHKINMFILLTVVISTPLRPDSNLNSINDLIKQEQYKEAIAAMKDLAPENPRRKAEISNAIGWLNIKSNNYPEAEKNLKSALAIAKEVNDEESTIVASNNLGILAFLENNLDEAEYYFKLGLQTNSTTALSYSSLIDKKKRELAYQKAIVEGVELRQNKEFEAATEKYDEAILINPDDARAHELKGYALFRSNDYVSALENFELARKLAPDRVFVHLNMVKVYCAMNMENEISSTIEDSKLGEEQFIRWYKEDYEFRKTCKNSAYLKELTTNHPLN